MDTRYSKAIEREIQNGAIVLRPGWVRLNFNYFIDETEFEYLTRAIELVAEHGWRVLPYYHFDESTGVWRYQGQERALPGSLESWRFDELCRNPVPFPNQDEQVLERQLESAERELLKFRCDAHFSNLILTEQGERLRWFVLPQEVRRELEFPEQANTLSYVLSDPSSDEANL